MKHIRVQLFIVIGLFCFLNPIHGQVFNNRINAAVGLSVNNYKSISAELEGVGLISTLTPKKGFFIDSNFELFPFKRVSILFGINYANFDIKQRTEGLITLSDIDPITGVMSTSEIIGFYSYHILGLSLATRYSKNLGDDRMFFDVGFKPSFRFAKPDSIFLISSNGSEESVDRSTNRDFYFPIFLQGGYEKRLTGKVHLVVQANLQGSINQVSETSFSSMSYRHWSYGLSIGGSFSLIKFISMPKQLYFSLLIFFSGSILNAQNKRLGTGGYSSFDLNFYQYFDGKPQDDAGKLRIEPGYTLGGVFEFSISRKSSLSTGLYWGKQKYFPERQFTFGLLTEVEIEAIEIPINIKIDFFRERTLKNYYPYLLIGFTFQKETSNEWSLEDIIHDPFVPDNRIYLIPSLSAGINYWLTKHLSARAQVSYYKGKCYCEYLSRAIGELNLGLMLLWDIRR